jgi:hypothetical protein
VVRVGKLGQRHVFACLPQALDIGSAGRNRNIIVRGAVKETDRLLAYIRIIDVRGETRRVERQIGSKRRTFRAMHALEAIEACVKSRLSSARESHKNDLRGIDAWMRGEHPQGSVGIENHIQTSKQCLIGTRALQATGREAVDGESRQSNAVEFLRPAIDVSADAARAVHQNDGWQAIGPEPWNPQRTSNRDRGAILSAGQEILIGQGQRRDRVKLGSGHLRLTRWRIQTDKSQADGPKKRYSKTDAHGWSLMCSQVSFDHLAYAVRVKDAATGSFAPDVRSLDDWRP